ncbi:prolyl oligopeptidase family serine peptidase [Idiomarina sp.]|jgi:acylaminoacyl-peptidase|uniref:S9 family peptidase n=1 Tax=Idiomarina sp. TaxID=1874361 RepID=UPI00351613E1
MWLKTSALVIGLATLSPSINAQTNDYFAIDDIFQLEYANDVSISPDGRYIAYIRNRFNDMKDNTERSVWILDTASNQHYPLFDEGDAYGNLTWSPDSQRLALTSNRKDSYQVHVYWLNQDKHAEITHVHESPSQLAWSPDGESIAFLMDVPAEKTAFEKKVKRPTKPEGADWGGQPIVVQEAYYQSDGQGVLKPAHAQVFTVPATGGSVQQLTTGAFRHSGPLTWSHDGESIVFSANRDKDWAYEVNDSDLYAVNVKTQQLTRITQAPGQEYAPQFSPDGERLVYLHSSDEPVPYHKGELWVMDWASKQKRELQSELDRSFANPQWNGEDAIAVQFADRGKTVIANVSLDDELTRRVDDVSGTYVSRPYTMGSFSASNNGAIAYTQGTPYRPADVGYQASGDETHTLTQLNEDLLGNKKLGKVHEITYNSSYDDQPIQGWYITPPDFDEDKEYPLIVEIHGGPHLSYGPHFAAEHQRYAAEGYVVLYVNYRGSTSYGKDFAMLLDGNYASEYDFADHMSGVDAMIDKGFVDADNLFIAGGSAGGIATAYAVGLTDRFNAAAATNPVINWVSKVLTADSSIGQITNQFPAMPWEDLDHYWKRSPLSLVGNVSTPVLLFTGENDRRTPISETEQFYQALKLRHVDTAMVRVPGASHGVTYRPSHMIAKIEHALAWFEHYKK